ncbi:MAG: tyrosine--tRNA ligase [Candidatus Shikimatogenerans bostrichidophilus]|nr:MAG: tyrosine--tRNA ligase [Candidatus Shikimatogenerans bostrichidophilus]
MLKKLKYLFKKKIIYNYTKNISFLFKKKSYVIYYGIDPTYYTLHLGHLVGLSILLNLYNKYNKIIIVIGGGTALIKLSKKSKKKKIINKNIKYLKKQILFLFRKKKISILNNYSWLKNKKILNFFNNILSIFSINSFLKIKLFKKKIKKKKNIPFNELLYLFIQGFDYFYLYKKYNCNLQIGGSDQWYNILTGIKLIKKKFNKKTYGFTHPLLLNLNGIKFSKSNNLNNIWLNKNKTSIYNFYQFLINLPDNININYLKLLTNFNIKNYNKIIYLNYKFPKKKIINKILIKYLISWVHGKKKYKQIKKVMYILFKKKKLNYIKNNILLIKKFLNKIYFKKKNKKKITIFDLIKKKKIFFSNSDYKKFIYNKGIFLINGIYIKNNTITNFKNLINNKYLIIKKGKKDFYILIIKK